MIRRTMSESYGRPRIFGPAFIIALVLCGYVLWRQNTDQPLAIPRLLSGPAPQRTPPPSRLSGSAPSPDFVLAHLRDLDLTGKARSSLEELSRKSAEELRPLKDQADRAADNFRRYMTGRERSGRTPMGDLQAQIDNADAALRRADEAAARYWRDALQVMTPEQKAELERKWQEERQQKAKSSQK